MTITWFSFKTIMFVSLADKNVAEYYRKGLGYKPEREIIALLLENLSEKSYADKLSAVTSMGNLFLTTDLRWNENSSPGSISIDAVKDSGKNLILMAYYSNNLRKPEAERRCSLSEAAEFIDLYVMRLIFEKYQSL